MSDEKKKCALTDCATPHSPVIVIPIRPGEKMPICLECFRRAFTPDPRLLGPPAGTA